MFSLTDDDDQWMSLRYDLTAPLARHVAENINEIQLPYRTYRAGYVFRNEKPGPGRFRQFMQFDADTVGAPGVQADAEMCMMMADVMEALGIKRGDYVIRVNNRKVLDGVMEAIGLGGDENAEKRLNVLRSIDKLDKFGVEGVRQLLGEGRKDESGDRTEGVGLDESRIHTLIRLLFEPKGKANLSRHMAAKSILEGDTETDIESVINDNFNVLRNMRDQPIESRTLYEGINELELISEICSQCGYKSHVIEIDPSCVRGLEYYTGPVLKLNSLFLSLTKKARRSSSARSAAAGGMMVSSNASPGKTYRQPVSPSAFRA